MQSLSIPSFQIFQHLIRSTSTEGLLVVNVLILACLYEYFFTQSTPLPANCLLGPSNNDHARGFGPGCIRHQTHRPNVKASIFLNLPTLLWRVSVHPGIDLLLPSYCAYIVRENRGRVTTTPLRTYTILCSNPH